MERIQHTKATKPESLAVLGVWLCTKADKKSSKLLD